MQRLRWLGKACAFVALVGLTGGCVSQSKYDNLLDHNRRLTALLNEADAEKERLKADLSQSQSSQDTQKKMLDSLDADNALLREAMKRAQEQANEMKGKMGTIEGVEWEGPGKLSLAGEVFFDSGKATIKKATEGNLKKVADVLKSSGLDFRIDGHTDSQPISRSGWKSNHDLAAARALAIFHFFRDDGIGEERMCIAGYGPNKPKAPNDTPDGMKKNRRVEILLLASSAPGAPKKAPAAAPRPAPAPKPAPAEKKPKT